MKTIGIIAAMPEEKDGITAMLNDVYSEDIYGSTFHVGNLNDKKIIVALCGIGKVNAVMCAVVLKERFAVDCIVATGVAGGISLGHLEALVPTGFVQHDVKIIGNPDGWLDMVDKIVIDADEKLSNVLCGNGDCVRGIMASGEQFIASQAETDVIVSAFPDAVAVDMECGALSQACYRMGVPFSAMKCISDSCSEMDFNEIKDIACKKSVQIIINFIHNI